MRDIWALQPRFESVQAKHRTNCWNISVMRAGYDFLLLRCESGEIDPALGEWWTDFMHGRRRA
jgi:poly(A) polymerase